MSLLKGRRQTTSDNARKRLRGERSPQPRSFWVWILSRALPSCCSCLFAPTALFSANLRYFPIKFPFLTKILTYSFITVIEYSGSVPPMPLASAAAVETVKINSPCGRNAAEERRQKPCALSCRMVCASCLVPAASRLAVGSLHTKDFGFMAYHRCRKSSGTSAPIPAPHPASS